MTQDFVPNSFGPDTRHDFHVLKDGDLFAVFPATGDMNGNAHGRGESQSKDGLFFRDTRYLSRFALTINGTPLTEIGHDAREDDAGFRSDLANTDLVDSEGTAFRAFDLHIRRDRFLSGGMFDLITITNFSLNTAELDVVIACWSDFRDIFEVRGATSMARGELMTPEHTARDVRLRYRTADGRVLSCSVGFDPPPVFMASRAHISLTIPPKARREISCVVRVSEHNIDDVDSAETVIARFAGADPDAPAPSRDDARNALGARLAERRAARSCITSSRPSFDAWLARSSADLAMLTCTLDSGPYPYAGVPWFAVPFGRDGLITALQVLWLDTHLAGGVLDFLAATQATEFDAYRDAEPGKILHEHRNGEMARTGAVPFWHYYGGIDQTLLFVILAHAYWKRTADRDRIMRLEPAIRAALDWAQNYGDQDGDGFIEYERSSDTGLRNQGWKDSDDSIFHANGDLCASPVALVEVQGYYVAACRAAADLFVMLGDEGGAKKLRAKADGLVERIDALFWDDDLQSFCIALDARDQPVRVSASNPGHLLFTGAVLPKRIEPLIATLSQPELLSGWGLRTVAKGAARFNPMGYHNGSIWPHDNSLIAWGAAMTGHADLASRITTQLFDASCHFAEHRLPELWCGFARAETQRPVAFPSACAPQAWAAGAPFLCLQACLGVAIDAPTKTMSIRNPVLPAGISELNIRDLSVGGSTMSLTFTREADGTVGVAVIDTAAGWTVSTDAGT